MSCIGKTANRNVLNGESPKPRGRMVQRSDKKMRPGQKGRGADRPRGGRVSRIKKPLTRKERRKQERLSRKNRATAVHNSKNGGVLDLSKNGQSPRGAKKKGQKVNSKELPVSKRHSKKISRVGEGERDSSKNGSNSRQSSAIMREDKEIARLEKLLKMKKRKKLPTSFREEGLNYLLDLTDKNSSEWNLSDDDNDAEEMAVTKRQQDSDSEPEETAVHISRPRWQKHRPNSAALSSDKKATSSPQKGILKAKKMPASSTKTSKEDKLKKKKKRVRFSLEGGLLESGSSEEESSSSEEEEEVEMMESNDSCGDDNVIDKCLNSVSCDFDDSADWSDSSDDFDTNDGDGYIETDDSEEGEEEGEGSEEEGSDESPATSITKASQTYVPPHLREKKSSKNLEKLRKTIQGLINRLSESNIQSISTQLERLYRENSRNDMNSTLCEVLLKSCVSPALFSDRLVLEHMMLVAILHHRIGQEVGAHVVQSLSKKLGSLLGDQPNYGQGKECDCVVLMLAHLYNYRVIHCLLIYDIIRKLVESFSERDVELLLLLLKSTGMEIRRDDAASLKEIILQIQSKAVSSNLSNSPRMRFMLETIAALRTNNARKIPNYDPSLLDHMKKLLRGLVQSSGSLDESQLKISLQDLLNADTHGRWWIVGSAWVGRETNSASSVGAGGVVRGGAGDEVSSESWVLELARRQRMSTDIRKNIFCVIMTSEDYVDAFEKLLKLGLKEVQEREIIHVLVDCCLQEKTFNPYYAHLGQKFCEFKRSHQVTLQYALWDRFKTLHSLTASNRSNLKMLVCHLVSTKSLSLSVLKVVEFGELEEAGVKFYKTLLRSLLLNNSEESVTAIFARLSPLPSLKTFRTELILFIKHFLGPSSSKELTTRIKLAEQAMKAQGHIF